MSDRGCVAHATMNKQKDEYSKRGEWNRAGMHAKACSHLVDCSTAMIPLATQPMVTKNEQQCVIWQV